MILDSLEHSARYEALHPLFAKALAFLRTVDGTQSLGRHDIDGANVFALVESYVTKPAESALFEAHRKYIDVQFIYQGRETILWAPLATMKEQTRPYEEDRDIAKWKLVPDVTPLHISAGHFAILFPQDAHAPCVEWGQPEQVFKVVVKVAVH
jgi:YhcH/YjgK/YiaL family protein